MELALWTLKIASMVPVILRFASIVLLAASRPQAVIMGRVQAWALPRRREGLNADKHHTYCLRSTAWFASPSGIANLSPNHLP